MRVAPVLAVLCAAAPAHAMGVYRHLDVLAWSADGAAALIARDTTSSGQVGSSRELIVVGARTPALEVSFTNTLDGDTATEHVSELACIEAAQTLQRTLATRNFKGVSVNAAACASASREVVTIGERATRTAANAWISPSAHSRLTWREREAREATDVVVGDEADLPASVATATGKLYIVVWGINGDDSSGAHATPVRPTRAGLVVAGDDLR